MTERARTACEQAKDFFLRAREQPAPWHAALDAFSLAVVPVSDILNVALLRKILGLTREFAGLIAAGRTTFTVANEQRAAENNIPRMLASAVHVIADEMLLISDARQLRTRFEDACVAAAAAMPTLDVHAPAGDDVWLLCAALLEMAIYVASVAQLQAQPVSNDEAADGPTQPPPPAALKAHLPATTAQLWCALIAPGFFTARHFDAVAAPVPVRPSDDRVLHNVYFNESQLPLLMPLEYIDIDLLRNGPWHPLPAGSARVAVQAAAIRVLEIVEPAMLAVQGVRAHEMPFLLSYAACARTAQPRDSVWLQLAGGEAYVFDGDLMFRHADVARGVADWKARYLRQGL